MYPFNYCRHPQIGVFVFPYVLGSVDPLGLLCLSRMYMAFYSFPRTKHPCFVFILRTKSRDCHFFMKNKLSESKLPEGQEWMQTQTYHHPIQNMPHTHSSACLCKPTGNLRMLILDVKSKINVKLSKLCHLGENRCRVSKGQLFWLINKNMHRLSEVLAA